MKLSVNGKPRFIKSININNPRNWVDKKKKESKYLEYDLLISNPTNKNKETLTKPCDKQIKIALIKEAEFILNNDKRVKFKWIIEEKAIIFFKSKNLHIELEHIRIPVIVIAMIKEERNLNEMKKEDKRNLNKP